MHAAHDLRTQIAMTAFEIENVFFVASRRTMARASDGERERVYARFVLWHRSEEFTVS